MSEKPILFSGEMVRAILEGRKTQTRRILKVQPIDILPMKIPNMWVTLRIKDQKNPENNRGNLIGCRYGRVGDRLWVRESFRELIDLGAGTDSSGDYYEYKADGLPDYNPDVKWKPSIHMPREASRITLEIVSVRVERLQEITKSDAKAEGVSNVWHWDKDRNAKHPEHFSRGALSTYVANYSVLWDKLNKERGYGWNVNPFVWVVEFKKVEQ